MSKRSQLASSLSFNFLESCIEEAISFAINPLDASAIRVLTARLGFDAKVGRLEAIVKHFQHSFAMPKAPEPTRLRAAADFRNRLVHSTISLKPDRRHGTLISRGVVVTESAATARRIGRFALLVCRHVGLTTRRRMVPLVWTRVAAQFANRRRLSLAGAAAARRPARSESRGRGSEAGKR
jgi:hypothetical protein